MTASTYQAVSGAGVGGMRELEQQVEALAKGEPVVCSTFPYQIAYNLIPQIGSFDAQGYSSELARKSAERLELDDGGESEALDKTIAKAMRLYASRFEGDRLQQKIITYCLQKGFPSDMARQRLEEREWNDNE